jgi:dipeptidyl aminopeptidase/acylaminoacyl peptidase
MPIPIAAAVSLSFLVAAAGADPQAASTDSVYREPDPVLVEIVDAAPPPDQRLSPDRAWVLLLERKSLPSIAELAEEELRLGGLRINPRTNGPSRTRPYSGLKALRLDDRTERPVTGLPDDPRIENVAWSPNSERFVFTHTTSEGIELWVAELASGEARRLLGPRLSFTAREAPRWLADGRSLLCTLVPDGRGPRPEASRVPSGPVIQENIGRATPARTYQDLLKNVHDEALFEHFLTAQLARVELEGQVVPLGKPGILWHFDPSPDGEYVMVETIHRPFSYLVPAYRFPERIEIWDREGRVVREIADLPLRDEIPIAFGSVATGPRDVGWRADTPASLLWAEALDGGDAARDAEERDRLYTWAAPFTGEPVPLATLSLRYGGIQWGDGDLALVEEWWWKTRKVRAWRVRPDAPGAAPQLVFERSFEDRYADPGRPVTIRNCFGRPVIQRSEDGGALFLIGRGASPEGDRPFFDRLDLESLKIERLFLSEAPYFERPVAPLDGGPRRLLTSRESPEEPPNLFVRDLEDGGLTQVTTFPHPTPQLLGIQKELIRYRRKDGVDLTATLYLPKGYSPEADGPLPALLWAYPVEYKSADAAGQVKDSPYRFDRVGGWSPLLWLTQGFAVLDDPTMPIVGEGDEEPNDTYVAQLVASAQAAVDEVVRRGVADRKRLAIGGHSYGAFMAANLLAHSDLFAAGIARSGAYNRTLTPFGFQAEERKLWEALDVYIAMSPFMHAAKVNEPLLLIHGDADNNSGTFPLQSERFYSAVKGLGGTVRLVMLPHESHGYRARESILHMLWETGRWLATYVESPPPEAGGSQ